MWRMSSSSWLKAVKAEKDAFAVYTRDHSHKANTACIYVHYIHKDKIYHYLFVHAWVGWICSVSLCFTCHRSWNIHQSLWTCPMSKTVGRINTLSLYVVSRVSCISTICSLSYWAWGELREGSFHRSMVGRTHMRNRTLTDFQTRTWTWTRLRCNTDIWGNSSETMTTHRQ